MRMNEVEAHESALSLALSECSIVDKVMMTDEFARGGRGDEEGMDDSPCDGRDEQHNHEIKHVQRITKKETRNIRIWRAALSLVILVSGAFVSWGTYNNLDRQSKDEAYDKYHVLVNTIEDGALMHFKDMREASGSLSLTLTAQANRYGWTFPFVTMENWEVHASEARKRGGIEIVAFLPYLQHGDGEIQAFNQYAAENREAWQLESIAMYKILNPEFENSNFAVSSNPVVYNLNGDEINPATTTKVPATGPGPVTPLWMQSPPSQGDFSIMLRNMYPDLGTFMGTVEDAFADKRTAAAEELVFGYMGQEIDHPTDLFDAEQVGVDYDWTQLQDTRTIQSKSNNHENPLTQVHGLFLYPVLTQVDKRIAQIGGFIVGVFGFEAFLVDLLPNGVRGIRVVIQNSCNDTYTYELDGNKAVFMGPSDQYDGKYAHLRREIHLDSAIRSNYSAPQQGQQGHCSPKLIITPTELYMEDNESNLPLIFTVVVAVIFAFMANIFMVYDIQVQRRNTKMIDTAARSNAIVSSIFPSSIRDRLLNESDSRATLLNDHSYTHSNTSNSDDGAANTPGLLLQPTKTHLKSYLVNHKENAVDDLGFVLASKPIADLFTETTIMFADISGFTAWSSVREPSQVFTLLETVYRAFDMIAKRRGVFKVETVGDCYVAVCGLPDPRKDHAVVMTRFARECLARMHELSRRLDVVLGPGTGELGMRIGLHSGPVTAGVLRGERSRFQLFGDTVNTASRMETTGEVNRIHISEETANLLTAAGKEHWLLARSQPVKAKGKGILSTFWLKRPGDSSPLDRYSDRSGLSSSRDSSRSLPMVSSKMSRLVDWYVEVLLSLLKQVVRRRKCLAMVPAPNRAEFEAKLASVTSKESSTILDEVEEVIQLPRLNTANLCSYESSNKDLEIPEIVTHELAYYVTEIASLYHGNPFHNFEHSAHVAMSVVKLLSRIVAPSELDYENSRYNDDSFSRDSTASLHDHTYGITSDPLTQFSCVLSALIHDVDHPGVPNAQLVKEDHELAVRYKGKSVAEQNSVELAWEILMEQRFENLRSVIYISEVDFKRFRQLVVNSVMATDIVDKELKALRNDRWDKAFNNNSKRETSRVNGEQPETSLYPAGELDVEREQRNRKATIVIEHLIQASDVSHTMQHWHIYRKWNERFFRECYQAYTDGRADKNPADFWYEGEIGFFDFYIIPLAKKLKECGVFGVSSDEYLNYAIRNRDQWTACGQEIVSTMVEQMKWKTPTGKASAMASVRHLSDSDDDDDDDEPSLWKTTVGKAKEMASARHLSETDDDDDDDPSLSAYTYAMDPTEDPTESTWTESTGWFVPSDS